MKINLEKFHDWLKMNFNSKKTVKNYFQQVNRFFELYSEFNQDNIDKYILKLIEEEYSKSQINAVCTALKKYGKYSNIDIKFPKQKTIKRKGIKYYFTEKDMEHIYKHLNVWFGEAQEKELVLRFMFYTGARTSEVINLKCSDIKFDKKMVNFYGAKGNKDRSVYFLDNKTFDMLKRICDNSSQEKMFGITRNQIEYMMKTIQKNLKLEDEVIEPRTMRISFAKFCLSKGIDILILKKLMGHTDIKVTEIYAEPDEKLIKEKCENIRKGKLK